MKILLILMGFGMCLGLSSCVVATSDGDMAYMGPDFVVDAGWVGWDGGGHHHHHHHHHH